MKRIRDEVFDGFKINGSQVTVSIQEQTDSKRHKMFITYGNRHFEILDLWSYFNTAASNEVCDKCSDTLVKYLLTKSNPLIGYFCGIKVIFIHPEELNGDGLIIWCVETDEVDWIYYREVDNIPEIVTSEKYALKFGLWSVNDYKRIRCINCKGDKDEDQVI